MLERFHPGMNHSVVGHEFYVMNQQYILNKGSQSRNMHKTRLYIPLGAMAQYLLTQCCTAGTL